MARSTEYPSTAADRPTSAIPNVMRFALDDSSGWSAAFRGWGYPVWFRMTIGVIEVLAAACLLWGRTAIYGAAMIVAVMLGGMATHIIQDGGRHLTSEIVPLVLSTIVLIARRREVMREIRIGRVVPAARSIA
jgi:uncharacterized membrane protein YphA (DoxX/SURF4 family)